MIPRRLLTVLLFTLLPVAAEAQVSVRPAAMYLTPERLEAEIALSNTAGTALRLRLAIVDRGNSSGRNSGAGSCASWCALSLPELQLLPDRSVVQRVLVIPPAGVPDGEYHALLLVEGEGGVQQRIPIHFRVGEVYSDVKLADVSVQRTKEDVRFLLHLEQLGNAAYRGNLQLRIENDAKKTIFESADRVDVYGAKTQEYVLPAAKARKGRYRLFLHFNSDREDLGELAIPVLPKKFIVEISMS